MKHSLLGLFLTLSSLANAQESLIDSVKQAAPGQNTQPPVAPLRRNVLKISPLSLLAGQLSVFYERALTDSLSIVVGYGMGSNSGNLGMQLPEGGGTYQRLTVEGRYYWSNRVLNGFYAGPYLRLSRFTASTIIVDTQGQAIRDNAGNRQTDIQRALIWIPGLMVGRQFQLKRFAIDPFIGFQFQIISGTLKSTNQFVGAMSRSFALRFGLNIGYAF